MSRILLIDDDAFAGAEIQAILIDAFHEAILVRDAATAIPELASSRFDLVIVDIMQTGMDGIALIGRLRDLALTLPVIAMTGRELSEPARASLDFANLAIEAGATCCLRRPLDPGQLLEAVNSNLGFSRTDPVPIDTSQQNLSAESFTNPAIAILQQAVVPPRLWQALVALRQCVQEPWQQSESEPYGPESVRDAVACALEATEQLFLIIEPNREMASGTRGAIEANALGRRAINLKPALQPDHRAVSPARERLTPRERQVLALVTDGVSNKIGGFRLSISVRTFEAHRANVMRKLGAKNAAQLVRFG